MKKVFVSICLMVSLLMLTYGLNAQNSWTGATSADWNTASNWTLGVPAASQDVVIISGTPFIPVISAPAFANSIHITPGASLTNNAGGILTLVGLNSSGLRNEGTVNNNGAMIIGTTVANAGQDGIFNIGTFSNMPNATIEINYFWGNGIWNAGSSTFHNDGEIYIGTIANVGVGILCDGISFVNSAGAEIHIDRVYRGITNVKIFDNSGLIRIGATVPPTERGILNVRTNLVPPPVFTNHPCGIIESFGRVSNKVGGFINNGFMKVQTNGLYLETALRINSPVGISGTYTFSPAAFGASMMPFL
jgi:hypothetical protein